MSKELITRDGYGLPIQKIESPEGSSYYHVNYHDRILAMREYLDGWKLEVLQHSVDTQQAFFLVELVDPDGHSKAQGVGHGLREVDGPYYTTKAHTKACSNALKAYGIGDDPLLYESEVADFASRIHHYIDKTDSPTDSDAFELARAIIKAHEKGFPLLGAEDVASLNRKISAIEKRMKGKSATTTAANAAKKNTQK